MSAIKMLARAAVRSFSTPSRMKRLVDVVKKEAKKAWNGCKLLGSDAKFMIRKKYAITFQGELYSLKERKAMSQTSSDLLKMIPFSFFIIVPGAELTLPLFLYIFPNMMPSTFVSKSVQQERRELMISKRNLYSDKLLSYLITKVKAVDTAADLLRKLRTQPEAVTRDDLRKHGHLFDSHIRFGKMQTQQLLDTCRFIGFEPWTGFKTLNKIIFTPASRIFGTSPTYEPQIWPLSSFMRNLIVLQLVSYIRNIRNEDTAILKESIEAMDLDLLTLCCQDRCIEASLELSSEAKMRAELAQWVKDSTYPTERGLIHSEALFFSQIFQYIEDVVITPEVEAGMGEIHEDEEAEDIKEMASESMERILLFDSKGLKKELERWAQPVAPVVSEEERKALISKLQEVLDDKVEMDLEQPIKDLIQRLQDMSPIENAEEGPNMGNK
mmetsp:Transcript_26250/g.46934  ORF Transcript_26250/g.46934 Transcript_26250/m.46934 type:complete len:440 (+) Transcript_26250:4316-5635(+)